MNEWQMHNKMVDAETVRMRWMLVKSDPPPEDTQLLLYGSWHSLSEAQYPATMGSYADSLQVYCGAFENSHSRNGVKTWQDKWGDKFHAPVYWMPLPKPPGSKG